MGIDYAAAVRHVLARDYPVETGSEVAARLADYGREPGQRETARVQLAVLHLSAGDPDKVDYYLQRACEDYRDLLCWAEYPLTAAHPGLKQTNPHQYQALRDRERRAYRCWIEGSTTPP